MEKHGTAIKNYDIVLIVGMQFIYKLAHLGLRESLRIPREIPVL